MTRLSIYRIIPSLITVTSFIFGFNAIIFAIDGHIEKAIIALLISGVLDMFDGRIARLLDVKSKFGAELDSLSDFLCFGVGTAFIVLFFQDSYSNLMLVACTFFSVCAMLRLARFNLDSEDTQVGYEKFFVGLPTPAAFGLGIFPIAIFYTFAININTTFYAFYIIIVGFLMVSVLPTPSLKSIKIPRKFLAVVVGILALLIILLVKYTWLALTIVDISYFIALISGLLVFYKNKKI